MRTETPTAPGRQPSDLRWPGDGVRGRGATAELADAAIVVATVNPDAITPIAEGFQAVLWHLIVSHPAVSRRTTTWESTRA